MAEKLKSMQDLFKYELMDLYDAEHRILESLPKMVDAVSSPELKQAFEKQIKQTEDQKTTLEQVFQMTDLEPKRETCKGIIGVIDESEEVLKMGDKSPVVDAALIGSVQKIEHYEIAGYGTLRTHCRQLGYNGTCILIQKVLDQKGQVDHELTMIAEETVNPQAARV